MSEASVISARGSSTRTQASALRSPQPARAANVASQPKLSPFRYPGGKTWLIPELRRWLSERPTPLLIEPFAGGATASLVAVIDGYAERAVLIERDPAIAAVWKVILSRQANWLVDRVINFRVTPDSVSRVLSTRATSTREIAFQTLLMNRVRRGGVMAKRASLLKQGERGRGLASRWYPDTLALRIAQINSYRDQLSVEEGDGLLAIQSAVMKRLRARFFIDPPYADCESSEYRRLYRHGLIDHWKLFEILARSNRDFLMTYAYSPYIDLLRCSHGIAMTPIEMRTGNGIEKMELLLRPKQELLDF